MNNHPSTFENGDETARPGLFVDSAATWNLISYKY